MRYAVTVLVLVGVAVAYVPSSFRWQSTAGLWEDDYDLLFEPARIPLIEGSRAYTALSNLVSHREEQFGTNTANVFLVGGSTDRLGPVYPGLVYDRTSYRAPLETGLYGHNEEPLFGTGKVIHTELLDLDSNGTYDYKREDVTEAMAWDDGGSADYYFGAAYQSGSLRAGLGFARADSSSTVTDPDFNYTYDRRDSSLVDGRVLFTQTEAFDGDDRLSVSRNRFILGGWYDTEDWNVGLSGGFALMNETDAYTHRGQTLEDRSPANPLIEDYAVTELLDTMSLPYVGNMISATASAFYVPREEVESRFYLTLYTQSQSVSDGGGLEFHYVDSVCHPGTAVGHDSTFHAYSGQRAAQGIGVRTHQLLTLSEKFNLGFGAGFLIHAWGDSLSSASRHRTRYSYDNGDTIAGSEDYVASVTYSSEWVDRTTGSANVLSVPVGLEFKPWSPCALRLGALHQVTWSSVTRVEKLVASSPRLTRVEYGNGSSYEYLGDAEETPGISETTGTTKHTTEFSYGIGYSPIDHLQFDLMGFAKLTDLTGWKLSVTFKF